MTIVSKARIAIGLSRLDLGPKILDLGRAEVFLPSTRTLLPVVLRAVASASVGGFILHVYTVLGTTLPRGWVRIITNSDSLTTITLFDCYGNGEACKSSQR